MKKQLYIKFLIGFFMMFSLLLSGCNNPLEAPPVNNAVPGWNVRIALALPGGIPVQQNLSADRTLYPSNMNFTGYDFIFTSSGNAPDVMETKSGDDDFVFTLEVGESYSLKVNAYSGEAIAARGSYGTFEVTAAGTISLQVQLDGVLTGGSPGYFMYSITYPADAEIVELFLEDANLLEKTSISNSQGLATDTVSAEAGWHFFWVILKTDDGKTAGYADAVVVYPGQTTEFTKAFISKDFKSGPVFGDDGRRTYKWKDFDVEGWSHYWRDPERVDGKGGTFAERNYDPAMVIGYEYDTYIDEENVWSDVLKIVPPSDYIGENKYALAMTYDLDNGGSYLLSMWVKAEGGSADPAFCWLNTGGEDGDDYPYPGTSQGSWRQVLGGLNTVIPRDGQWHKFENTFPVWGNDEIGLLVNDSGSGAGLNGATVYFRDFRLEYKGSGTIVNPPEDQGFRITPASIVLEVGETRQLKAGKTSTVTWSSNSGAVTVDSNGLITAVSTGTATISASVKDEPLPATASVRVIQPGTKKYIAISFDDGPNREWTPRFMDVLEQHDATATFYLIGNNLPTYGVDPFVKEMFDRGHELGNHTLIHDSRLGNVEQAISDLQETQKRIYASTGKYPTSMRAPCLWYTNDLSIRGQPVAYASDKAAMGIFDDWEWQYGESIEEAARKVGLALMDATLHQANDFDTYPEMFTDRQKFLDHVKGLAIEWGILLMHDWVPNTYGHLPYALKMLQDEGYQILSVEKLLEKRSQSGLSYYELEPGRIYYRFSEMYDHVKRITILKDSAAVSYFEEDNDLSKGMVTVGLGGSITLTADVLTRNGGTLPQQEIYWYSDNKYIATVDRVTGVVAGEGWGTTTIRAVAGGKVASVSVIVDSSGPGIDVEIDTITSWAEFEQNGSIPGAGNPYNTGGAYPGSGAVVTIDSYHGFDDVVRLAPPAEGYPPAGIALTYNVPYSGMYTVTVDVFVESERNDVTIQWYDCSKFEEGGVIFRYDNVKTGEWVTYTGSMLIGKNCATGLLTRRYEDNTGSSVFGLRNSTVYIKNFKIEISGADVPVIDIRSGETSIVTVPVDKTITLEWARDGSLISGGSLTIVSGGKVTFTTKNVYPGYEWRIDGWEAPANTGRSFVFDSTGRKPKKYTVGLWVDGDPAGDAVEITVVEAQ